jgi:hypothetical protein
MPTRLPKHTSPVRFQYTPVSPAGQLFYAMESPGWPQTYGGSTLFQGPGDFEALERSFREAAESRPLLTARLESLRVNGRQTLIWRHTGEPFSVEVGEYQGDTPPDGPPDEWLSHIDRAGPPWEPLRTGGPPIRVRFTSLGDDLHVLSIWMHHAAGDSDVSGGFILDAFARYHRTITGIDPPFASLAVTQNTAFEVPEIDVAPFTALIRHLAELELKFPRRSVAHLAGEGSDAGPLSTTLMVGDHEEIAILRKSARALGGSITDLTIAAAKLSVAEWNSSVGAPAIAQRHAIAVNMRGRVAAKDDGSMENELSLVTVATKAEDWADPQALVALTAKKRRGHLEQGFDILALRGATVVERALARMPIRSRAFLVNRLLVPPQTMMISNMGITLPEIVDGQLTGRSMLHDVGGMELVCSVNRGNTTPKTPNLLFLISDEKGLTLTLSGNRANTSQSELDQITNLIRTRLLDLGSATTGP